jgi:hypothetical protein
MENPWVKLPDSPPYLLECDRLAVEKYNAKPTRKREQLIRTIRFPEPFQGDVNAPVVVLTGNPRSNAEDERSAEEFFRTNSNALRIARNNLLHQPSDYPWWTIDPASSGFRGHTYWSDHLRELIEAVGVDGRRTVSRRVLCVESFPYHSEVGGNFPALTSQQYSNYLVQRSVERGAVIILLRKLAFWQKAVPQLVGYSRLFCGKSPERGYVSPGNLPTEGWDMAERFCSEWPTPQLEAGGGEEGDDGVEAAACSCSSKSGIMRASE